MSILDSVGVSLDSTINITEGDYTTIPLSESIVSATKILNAITTNLKNEQTGAGRFLSRDTPQTITAVHNFSNGASGITKSQVGLGSVNNTSDTEKPISALQQVALDGLSSDINLKANINNPTLYNPTLNNTTFTGTVSGLNKSMVNLSNVDDTRDINKPVSSLQQIAIDTAISNLVNSSPALMNTLSEISNSLNNDPNFNSTMVGLLALKAPLANPTFTGTVSGISKSMVGLGNCNNTSDADKIVSDLTQIELNKKPNLASSNTYTGNTNTFNNHVVLGSTIGDTLTINGTTTVNGVDLTPGQLSKVQYLDVSSNISTQLDTKANKTYVDNNFLNIGNANANIGGVKTFNQINISGNGTFNNPGSMVIGDNNQDQFTCNATTTFTSNVSGITKSMVGLGNVNNTSDADKIVSDLTQIELDKKANLAGSNTYTGNNNNFRNNVALGSDTTDTLTINATTSLNGINFTPSDLSKVQYLSDITSNVKALIDAKTTNTAIQNNENTWTNTNDFNLIPTTLSQATLHNHLTNKTYVDNKVGAVISNNNSWTGVNQFNTSLPTSTIGAVNNNDLTNKQFCDNTYLKLAGNADIQGTKNFQNISVAGTTTCSGNASFVKNVTLGGDNLDIITLNGTMSSAGVSLTPSTISKVQYLSDTTSSVQDQINTKTTLSAVQSNNNSFSGSNSFTSLPTSSATPSSSNQLTNKNYVDTKTTLNEVQGNANTFTNSNTFNNTLTIREGILFPYVGVNGSQLPQYLEWRNNAGVSTGSISSSVSDGLLLNTASSKNISFSSGDLTNIVATINPSGVPVNETDITDKSYVDWRAKEYGPSIFQYGQRCILQSTSPLVPATPITSTECFLNFSELNFLVFNCMVEVSYTMVLALANSYTHSQTFSFNNVYSLNNNMGTITVTQVRDSRAGFGGTVTATQIVNGWSYIPLVFSGSLNSSRIRVNINFPNIANLGLTTRWIPLTHASVRVISSKPNGLSKMVCPVDFADPLNLNNANRSNSSGGHCYITET